MKFRTIYADPPWPESGGGVIKRGADRHYPLMKVHEIAALNVAPLAEDNAHLYLWTTNNYLPGALEVVKAWGFRYVTMITWKKQRISLGQYYRGLTEHCIFAVRGVLPYRTHMVEGKSKRNQGRTHLEADRTTHSRKPQQMRQWIEWVSHAPYLELFAREAAPGWSVWGDEAPDAIALPGLPQRPEKNDEAVDTQIPLLGEGEVQ